MTLRLDQSATAIRSGNTATFSGAAGVPPYTYAVVPGGAGGTIDANGLYQSPVLPEMDADHSIDTITVTDAAAATATATIVAGSPLFLFCDIIQMELGLAFGRVYLWNQKIDMPTDSGLFIAVSVEQSRAFGAPTRYDGSGSGLTSGQTVVTLDTLGVDIISKGPAARDRRLEVLLALASDYSLRQQYAAGFTIGKLPAGGKFLNLSGIDGAAIPYRFRTSVNIQYAYEKAKPTDYFSDFAYPNVITDPATSAAYLLITAKTADAPATDFIVAGTPSSPATDIYKAGSPADYAA